VLPGPEDQYIARLMGSERGGTEPEAVRDRPARRHFLQKAAAGTAAFAIPTIMTVDPARAQALTSPPPEPPVSRSGPGTVESVARSQHAGRSQASGRTELPRTGADIDRMVAAGLTATAGGAALVLWSADTRSRSGAPQPADPEPGT
jgi:hypothetical protein